MAEVVNLLNLAGEAFVAWAVRMLIQSSVLIAIVAALDLVLRRRVKAVVRYWVWLLVLVKLILPPSLSAPTGLTYWFGDRLARLHSPVGSVVAEWQSPASITGGSAASSGPSTSSAGPAPAGAPQGPSSVAHDAGVMSPPTASLAASLHWQAVVLGLWVVIVGAMVILLIRRALFVRALVAQSHEPPQAVTELLDQCIRRMGVRTRLTVRLSPQWASPSVCGIRRPVILIPEEMYGRLSPNELRSILLHELAHVARGDLWLNLVQALLQVVYFFHPLLWLANAQIRRVREQAVDETVLAAMGDDAEDYPRTLISVSKLAFGSSSLSLRLLGVVESKKELTDRIRRIVSRPFPKTAKLGLTGLLLVAFVAATLLPMAVASPGRPVATAHVEAADVTGAIASGPAGQTISGVVVDANGSPIAGAYVGVANKEVLPMPRVAGAAIRPDTLMLKTAVQTDSAGRFAFEQLHPGTTDLAATSAGRRTEVLYGVAVGTTDLHIVLGEPRPYQVSGVVVDNKGHPVTDARMTLVEESTFDGRETSPPLLARTNASGAFQFTKVLNPVTDSSARRMLFARKPGYAFWGRGLDCTSGEPSVRVTLTSAEQISGVVTDENGGPISGATVVLRGSEGKKTSGWILSPNCRLAPEATTRSDGSFTLDQVPMESAIYLYGLAEGYTSGMPSGSVHTGKLSRSDLALVYRLPSVDLLGDGDPNAPVKITLKRAVALHGHVTYEGTASPAKAIRVAVQGQRGGTWSEAVTDEAGRFEMKNVSPSASNVLVMIEGADRYTPPEWTAAAVSFNMPPADQTGDGISLALTKGGLVRGKVTDKEGNPLKGIDIAFYSAARPRPGAACQAIWSGADGTWAYRFPAGEVYVYVRTKIPGAEWNRVSYTQDITTGQTIEGIDFVLDQAVPENSTYRGVPAKAMDPHERAVSLLAGAKVSVVRQWRSAEAGNGHSYMVVRMPDAVSWTDANDIARRLGCYLATITSEAENEFVFRLIDDDTYWFHGVNWRGPWIGGFQPPGSAEPDGGWRWVTDEPFEYQNWDSGQPNDYNGTAENYLIYGNQRRRINTWNDVVVAFSEAMSFVLEYDR